MYSVHIKSNISDIGKADYFLKYKKYRSQVQLDFDHCWKSWEEKANGGYEVLLDQTIWTFANKMKKGDEKLRVELNMRPRIEWMCMIAYSEKWII